MTILSTYLRKMHAIHATGAAVAETSYYGALESLLNDVGATLTPRIHAVLTLQNRGAGLPDGGLFTKEQLQQGDQPLYGQLPARGAIEVKGVAEAVERVAQSEQVRRYLDIYGVVLVTTYREFLLVAREGGVVREVERYSLAESADAFWATVQHSAALGRRLAQLLDPEQPVSLEGLAAIGPITHAHGGQLTANDLALTAGWGYAGRAGITMPGRGTLHERPYTDAERDALATIAERHDLAPEQLGLGEQTTDIYLNEHAYWRNVPRRVWEYTLGGYPVLKKWLSYREQPLLGRPLTLAEVRYVSEVARRIAAILLLEPALNGSYAAAR